MKDFSGRIAVVTGGGSGMGRELVRSTGGRGLCHRDVPPGRRNANSVVDIAAMPLANTADRSA